MQNQYHIICDRSLGKTHLDVIVQATRGHLVTGVTEADRCHLWGMQEGDSGNKQEQERDVLLSTPPSDSPDIYC